MNNMNNLEENEQLFWFNNIKVLFQPESLIDFIPTNDITNQENLNSILRLSIYVSLILFSTKRKIIVFMIPIVVGIITIFINNWNNVNVKTEKLSIISDENEINTKLYPKDCAEPTEEDILMNTKVTDLNNPDSDKKEACQLTDDTIKKQDELLTKTIYRDVNDIYGKNNSQRQFFTMPNTSSDYGVAAGDTGLFSKWLYGVGPTCKEDTMRCTNSRSLINNDLRRNRNEIY